MEKGFPEEAPAKPRAGLTTELREEKVTNIYCTPAVYQEFDEYLTQITTFFPHYSP